jgi:hypothetical protein
MGFGGLGRLMVISGLILAAAGGVLWLLEKGAPPGMGWIGRLPGDIFIQRKHFTFYFPLATGLILSVILSFILWLVTRR